MFHDLVEMKLHIPFKNNTARHYVFIRNTHSYGILLKIIFLSRKDDNIITILYFFSLLRGALASRAAIAKQRWHRCGVVIRWVNRYATHVVFITSYMASTGRRLWKRTAFKRASENLRVEWKPAIRLSPTTSSNAQTITIITITASRLNQVRPRYNWYHSIFIWFYKNIYKKVIK